MASAVRALLLVARQAVDDTLQHNGITDRMTGALDAIDHDRVVDAAGLLSFLERVPDGNVSYEKAVLILAIRHQCNNTLTRIFTPLSLIGSGNPLRARFEILFAKFSDLQDAYNNLIIPPRN